MRILIATTMVPFIRGGAEMMVEGLAEKLRERGHDVDVASLPFKWYPPEKIADHMLACRLLDVTESCGETIDRVISIKFPAYLVSHPHKVLWLAHQHRAVYDGWVAGTSELLQEPLGKQTRDLVRAADANILAEARKIYTISKTVSSRLRSFCGMESESLYHPPPNADRFRKGSYGHYFLVPGRITGSKRQKLVMEAVKKATAPVRVCFIGPAEGPRGAAEFQRLIDTSGASDRVSWIGNLSEDRKVEAYAECRAVIFPPFEEDYGYITLEAMLAEKAVITCTDSAGPLEFVRDRETGLICAPSADALAEAMDDLWNNPLRAEAFGRSGRKAYDDADISWDKAISCLLA